MYITFALRKRTMVSPAVCDGIMGMKSTVSPFMVKVTAGGPGGPGALLLGPTGTAARSGGPGGWRPARGGADLDLLPGCLIAGGKGERSLSRRNQFNRVTGLLHRHSRGHNDQHRDAQTPPWTFPHRRLRQAPRWRRHCPVQIGTTPERRP